MDIEERLSNLERKIVETTERVDLAAEDEHVDDMYDQAVAIVAESRQASILMIQRRLWIGYNRSARIVEAMEKEGIIGPADGSKPREVLLPSLPE
jgi:S-DNA-T family DNA segregation ATPase FtsK/SpoIIIE